jgi:hypothetical protein
VVRHRNTQQNTAHITCTDRKARANGSSVRSISYGCHSPPAGVYRPQPASTDSGTTAREQRFSGPFVYPEVVAVDADGILAALAPTTSAVPRHRPKPRRGVPTRLSSRHRPATRSPLTRTVVGSRSPSLPAQQARRLLRFYRRVFGHRVEGLRQNLLQRDGTSVLHVKHNVTVCVHRLGDCGVAKNLLHYHWD